MLQIFYLKEFGNIYTRIMDPTNDVLERVAAIENGLACVTVGSGQAASTFAIVNVCKQVQFWGSIDLYGGTVNLFTHTLKKLGIVRTQIHLIQKISKKLLMKKLELFMQKHFQILI